MAIGWTKELHATAMRYTNRGSEDVRLELVTTEPCMTVELTLQLKTFLVEMLIYDTTVATSASE